MLIRARAQKWNSEENRLREVERKVLAELMKNSRLSDRELAKVVGRSQPTVSRVRRKLEKEGYIKEYTVIPDFKRIGFEILAVTFARFKRSPNTEQLTEIRRAARRIEKVMTHTAIVVTSGIGLGYDRMVISLHENTAHIQSSRDL